MADSAVGRGLGGQVGWCNLLRKVPDVTHQVETAEAPDTTTFSTSLGNMRHLAASYSTIQDWVTRCPQVHRPAATWKDPEGEWREESFWRECEMWNM